MPASAVGCCHAWKRAFGATQYGINTGTATQEIEYRVFFNHQSTCDMVVPTTITGGPLEYTYRLHSSQCQPIPATLTQPVPALLIPGP